MERAASYHLAKKSARVYNRTGHYVTVDAGRAAYEAANDAVVGSVDRLVAVWDGDAGQRAGTGTVVELARERGLPVDVVWPNGAARS